METGAERERARGIFSVDCHVVCCPRQLLDESGHLLLLLRAARGRHRLLQPRHFHSHHVQLAAPS